jgi:hypothetical protein
MLALRLHDTNTGVSSLWQWCWITSVSHHTLDPIYVCLIVAGWLFLSLMQMRATVHDVATYFPTAIISGRGRQKVCECWQHSLQSYYPSLPDLLSEVASPFWRSLSDRLRQGRVERWCSLTHVWTPNYCVETHPLVVLLQVFEFVQLPELFYAGSHGMDIMGPADGCNGFKATGTRSKDKEVCQHPFSVHVPVIFCQPSFKLEWLSL